MSPVFAALRIARRDALRHRWRSLLVVVLILVPVAAATGVDILWRTAFSTQASREIAFGGAEAIVTAGGCGVNICVDSAGPRRPTPRREDLVAALPPGSRWIPAPAQTGEQTTFSAPGRLASASLIVTDHLGDPLIRRYAQIVSGRAPAGAGEAAISRALADRLGISDPLGAQLTTLSGVGARITAVVRDPDCLNCERAVVPKASPIAAGARANSSGAGTILVDLPAGLETADRSRLGRLAQVGALVELRAEYGQENVAFGDLSRVSEEDVKAAAAVTLVAGLGLLEVVLLAGTAFAVGARRQTRALGLLAAQGAAPAQVRRVVLAQGLLLGTLGSALGVGLGFLAVALGRPVYERFANEVLTGFSFGPLEIVFVAVVGVLSGAAAALFPALRAGRRPAVEALGGRFAGTHRGSRRATAAGGGLVAAAALLAYGTARWMDSDGGGWFSYAGLGSMPSRYVSRHNQEDGALLILVAVFLAVAGLLLLAPAILAGLARLSARLPVTVRLAGRDASRHAHRTGPAMAAITVALGIAVAVSCLIATETQSENDLPPVPDRAIAVSSYGAVVPERLGEASRAAAEQVPGAVVFPVVVPTDAPEPGSTDHYATPLAVLGDRSEEATVGIGDADLVVLASGRQADRSVAADALAAGKAVVFDARFLDDDGTVSIGRTFEVDAAALRLPAVVLPNLTAYRDLPGAFVGPQVAQAQNWPTMHRIDVVAWNEAVGGQAARAEAVARNLGFEVHTAGDRDAAQLVRWAVGAAAVLIGLFGVAVCVALAAAEGRPDLGTLAAVGAPPSRRRRLGAAAALVPATLGTVLGLALGFFFAQTALGLTSSPSLIVPWADLLPMAAAMPVLAALIGVVGSLGRTPLTRRVD